MVVSFSPLLFFLPHITSSPPSFQSDENGGELLFEMVIKQEDKHNTYARGVLASLAQQSDLFTVDLGD